MAKTPSAPESPASDADTIAGKGRPTPTRREKEAARKRPLVSNDRTESRRRARAEAAERRERARIGMANGEERYLPLRDRGPQKKFVRDYIDARFSAGELLIPMMVVALILTALPRAEIAAFGIIILWAFFLVAIVDCIVVGLVVRRKLGEKFGVTRVESGVRWYAAMRALQMRVLRLPKPQVKRGQRPA